MYLRIFYIMSTKTPRLTLWQSSDLPNGGLNVPGPHVLGSVDPEPNHADVHTVLANKIKFFWLVKSAHAQKKVFHMQLRMCSKSRSCCYLEVGINLDPDIILATVAGATWR